MSIVIVRVRRVYVPRVGVFDRIEYVTEQNEVLLVEYRCPQDPGSSSEPWPAPQGQFPELLTGVTPIPAT